jgi:hypothetical protein
MMFGLFSMTTTGTTVSVAMLCGALAVSSGQTPGSAAPAPTAAHGTASATVQPALGTLRQTVDGLSFERWKLSKALREATVANVGSIRRDLDSTLPGLLATADAAPNSVAGTLPVSRNLGALYDVLLRVTVIADSSAPPEQAAALAQSMTSLEGARRALDERLQSGAVVQEQRVVDLQKTLASRPATVTPVQAAPVAVPCKPAVRAKRKTAPKTAPAASTPPAAKAPGAPQN